MIASAQIRQSLQPEKHYALQLETQETEYLRDSPIPAKIILLGIDVPSGNANYCGEVVLRVNCGGQQFEMDLGRMENLAIASLSPTSGPSPSHVITVDLRKYLPVTEQDVICTIEAHGKFIFYPSKLSQFPPIAEYGNRTNLKSNKARFIVRTATER
ncbi:MAG: hypothetical protein JW849_08415 [Phycisphaerae bacterium]|nr:hypothetical protein [Phycisphaerae bacterium]